MWSQKPVCGLLANNVGSFAAIVGPTSRVFAANVGRQVPLFAGQPPDDCGPLQLFLLLLEVFCITLGIYGILYCVTALSNKAGG